MSFLIPEHPWEKDTKTFNKPIPSWDASKGSKPQLWMKREEVVSWIKICKERFMRVCRGVVFLNLLVRAIVQGTWHIWVFFFFKLAVCEAHFFHGWCHVPKSIRPDHSTMSRVTKTWTCIQGWQMTLRNYNNKKLRMGGNVLDLFIILASIDNGITNLNYINHRTTRHWFMFHHRWIPSPRALKKLETGPCISSYKQRYDISQEKSVGVVRGRASKCANSCEIWDVIK